MTLLYGRMYFHAALAALVVALVARAAWKARKGYRVPVWLGSTVGVSPEGDVVDARAPDGLAYAAMAAALAKIALAPRSVPERAPRGANASTHARALALSLPCRPLREALQKWWADHAPVAEPGEDEDVRFRAAVVSALAAAPGGGEWETENNGAQKMRAARAALWRAIALHEGCLDGAMEPLGALVGALGRGADTPFYFAGATLAGRPVMPKSALRSARRFPGLSARTVQQARRRLAEAAAAATGSPEDVRAVMSAKTAAATAAAARRLGDPRVATALRDFEDAHAALRNREPCAAASYLSFLGIDACRGVVAHAEGLGALRAVIDEVRRVDGRAGRGGGGRRRGLRVAGGRPGAHGRPELGGGRGRPGDRGRPRGGPARHGRRANGALNVALILLVRWERTYEAYESVDA